MSAPIDAAREAFVADLLNQKPGDEPYNFETILGEIENYRLRRALHAAIEAYQQKDKP